MTLLIFILGGYVAQWLKAKTLSLLAWARLPAPTLTGNV